MPVPVFLVSLAVAMSVAAGRIDARRPNLLVFLVDDLGWQDTAIALHETVPTWQPRYVTPAVERLAAEGVVFRQAYASAPVCTPTRTSLLTGRSPARNGITYWILHAGRDTSAELAGLAPPPWNVDGLQPGDVTLPALLSAAGYRTIHVGKAHLGAVGTPGADPTALGFDVNVAGHGAGAPASYRGAEGFGRGVVWDVPGLSSWHGQDVFLTEALTAEAIAAVRAAVAEDEPFFLHMAPYAVHTPITANPRHLDGTDDMPAVEAAYASMIASVDASLGALLALLDELGVADDTIVVFTSDNGGLSAHGRAGEPHEHNAPLRSGKGSAYEGGVRVPFIVRWPGVTRSGASSDAVVVSHDLFPTLLAAADVVAPADRAATLDGVDLSAVLAGGPAGPRELLWHQPHFWGVRGPGIWPYSALRAGDWKLIYRHADRGFELYDLATDIGERHDRAREQPERVVELAGRLGRRLADAGAALSTDTTTGAPIPTPEAAAEAWAARARADAEGGGQR